MSSSNDTLNAVAAHILKHIPSPRPSESHLQPLCIALQGPQGSGKTYLCNQLKSHLSNAPHHLRIVVLSIDDLYLPYDALKALGETGNPLLRGRGLPGTHDIPLGIRTLTALQHINDSDSDRRPVDLPFFDKGLYDGFGDRSRPTTIDGPVDVVIFEGWCVGFCPLTSQRLEARWHHEWQKEVSRLSLGALGVSYEHIVSINDELRHYIPLWDLFTASVQIAAAEQPDTSPYANIYAWRVEQEHYMKKHNGGRGMTDDEVKKFVDRYIAGYVFFGDGMVAEGVPWLGRGLRVEIGKKREVVTAEAF